ncbi:MAG: carboxypeptidase regulatory-like domain-containing protein [Actinobacteria bacterium]|nr:carboxypeptidase regulatory-like domain-containing protein [Actinomycetota bacterium]
MTGTRPDIVLARRLVPCLVLAGLLLALLGPARAEAGDYTISTCQASGAFESGAFEVFATRGMKWRRACNPLGPGLRGLVTANVAKGGHVPVGAESGFVLEAPPETTFQSLRWSGYAHRRDCRYALQLYAVKPEGATVAIRNVRADHGCPSNAKEAQASSWPRPSTYELGGATRIVQRVICAGAPQAEFCSGKGQNYLQTFVAEATVSDPTPPSVSMVADGPLARGEWVRGAQSVGYEASDNTGIRDVEAWVGGAEPGNVLETCDYSQRVPCPDPSGQIAIETTKLPEGTQQLHLTAQDASGNSGESSPVTVKIDNTAPAAVPIAVEGGEAWRSRDGFDLVWANPPEPDRAPITTATYRLCRVGGPECSTGTVGGEGVSAIPDLTVPAPGEWEVRMWRTDAAGNVQPENASLPVRLRYDPEPPKLGFEEQNAGDPTRVSVAVSDPVSGVAGGGIELSRAGSGIWQALPTTLEAESHLVARIDDAALPAGEYELRADASDRAGNLATTTERTDGQAERLTLPLRTATSLGVGVLERHEIHKTVRRHGKSRKVTHKVSALVPARTVDFGTGVRIEGSLTDRAGGPVAGATVLVFSQPPEEEETQVASLTTGAEGGFAWTEKAEQSSSLRVVYQGTATSLPTEAHAEVLVHGGSTLKVDKAHVLNGQSVVFSGRVEGRPLPSAGKLVELQVLLAEEWSTFETTRTGPDGRWSIRYPFKRSCGRELFEFRPHVPGEANWPLLSGNGPRVAVHVRGRPCSTG